MMKKNLNLKIALFLLTLGYSLPSLSMSTFVTRLKTFLPNQKQQDIRSKRSSSRVEPATPIESPWSKKITEYDKTTDITTITETSLRSSLVEKTYIQGIPYREDGISYGNEIGLIFLSPQNLVHLAVHPNYRGKGHGTWLLEQAKNHCQNQGSAKMELVAHVVAGYGSKEKTLSQKQLEAFYERSGGKKIGDSRFVFHLPPQNTKQA